VARTLNPQDKISHYRVVGPLGSGGMGEVYIAQDQNLERSVALKVLPADLVRNEERVRRFVREAKSASSLSHPNIVTIYEIGQGTLEQEGGPGDASDPIHFISMELVTGETLWDKIHTEKTDLRTLLGYLAQAAEGVSKAHAAGIVHRDLKPSNIMISRDGYAKVLDFGLAKLTEREPSPEEMTAAVTQPPDITDDGMVLGTVGYMSPEQVRGKAVDHRSDIFSFGCILYEAVTRERPFTADSHVETMHKILHETPVAVELANPDAPRDVRRLIKRCLERNPDQRLQSMKDLAIELQDIVDEYDSLSPSGSSGTSTGSGILDLPGGRRKNPLLIAVGVIAVLGIAGAIFGLASLRRGTGSGGTAATMPANLQWKLAVSDPSLVESTLSGDGRYLAYIKHPAEGWGLWVRQVATGSEVQVVEPAPEQLNRISFSPDGSYLYFGRRDPDSPNYSTQFEVPSLGGAPRKRLFDVDSAIDFSPDGARVCFKRGVPQNNYDTLVIAELSTGNERVVAQAEPGSFEAPHWSPSGKHIVSVHRDAVGNSRLISVDVAGGEVRPLGEDWLYIGTCAWLPDDAGLVLNGVHPSALRMQVWRVSYPKGVAQRITSDMDEYDGLSASADGTTLALRRTSRASNLWTTGLSGPGQASQLTQGSARSGSVGDFTVTGTGQIVAAIDENSIRQLFLVDAGGSSPRQLTSGILYNEAPFWVPGSNTILVNRFGEDNKPHVWRLDTDGDNLTQLTHGEGEVHAHTVLSSGAFIFRPTAGDSAFLGQLDGGASTVLRTEEMTPYGFLKVSPDQQWLCFTDLRDLNGRTRSHWIVQSLDGEREIASFPLPMNGKPEWAPDSRALTYTRTQGETQQLVRQPIDGGSPTVILTITEGQLLGHRWSPDGKTVALEVRRGTTSNLWIASVPGGEPRPVTDFRSGDIFSGDWAPDGGSIVFTQGTTDVDVVLLRDFQ